jgi:preprotein translocase subunit SecE
MDKIKLHINKIKQFLRESKAELKKVTWPTPKEALASTSVVVVVVIVVSIFLGLVDLGLTRIIRVILG